MGNGRSAAECAKFAFRFSVTVADRSKCTVNISFGRACALIVWMPERGNALEIRMQLHRHRVYRARDTSQWEWKKRQSTTNYNAPRTTSLEVDVHRIARWAQMCFRSKWNKIFPHARKVYICFDGKTSSHQCECLRASQISPVPFLLPPYILLCISIQTTFRECDGKWKPLRLYL